MIGAVPELMMVEIRRSFCAVSFGVISVICRVCAVGFGAVRKEQAAICPCSLAPAP